MSDLRSRAAAYQITDFPEKDPSGSYHRKMTTITRDELQKRYTENLKKTNENKIQACVAFIQEKVLTINDKGDKSYCYIFHKGYDEKPEIVKEVARRLQEIFIDSKVIFHEKNAYTDNQIIISWFIK
jgi:hypothetical protein